MNRGAWLFALVLALAGCGGHGAMSTNMLSVAGRWSGPFQSTDTSSLSFTARLLINQDANGNLAAAASFIGSPCIESANLKGAIVGLNVTLSGSDSIGDSITLHGTTNTSGTQMVLRYTLNAGASGRCETDNGTGTLIK